MPKKGRNVKTTFVDDRTGKTMNFRCKPEDRAAFHAAAKAAGFSTVTEWMLVALRRQARKDIRGNQEASEQ